MNEADRRFSEEDLKVVQSIFGRDKMFSPQQIADETDSSLRKLKTPSIEPFVYLPPGSEVEVVLHSDIFLDRFYEDYFREQHDGNMRTQATNYVKGFKEWQDKYEEGFYIRNDRYSQQAADIIHSLTIEDTYLHALSRQNAFKGISEDYRYDEQRRSEATEKMRMWRGYAYTAKWAFRLDNHQQAKVKIQHLTGGL